MTGWELVLWGVVGALAVAALGLSLRCLIDDAEARARSLARGDDPGEVEP